MFRISLNPKPALFALASIAMLALAQPAAAASDTDVSGRAGERPNAGGPAIPIKVRLALLDIDDIDDKEQRFSVDSYYEISWLDPRLALDAAEGVANVRTFGAGEIWTPGLTIINNRGLTLMLPEVASVDIDGNVTLRQRLSGPLAVDLDLREFPFDLQQLGIVIVSYRYGPSDLVFDESSELIARPSTFSADGWQFEALPTDFSVYRLAEGGAGSSQLTFGVIAERNSDYFVLTLALPMALILFMAWSVHWLQPEIIPARIGMSTATVFSLIALGVSFRLTLPQIDYLTHADRFVIYSTLLVSASLGSTVMATRWVSGDRAEDARRLATYTRWGFPVVFALIVALTLLG